MNNGTAKPSEPPATECDECHHDTPGAQCGCPCHARESGATGNEDAILLRSYMGHTSPVSFSELPSRVQDEYRRGAAAIVLREREKSAARIREISRRLARISDADETEHSVSDLLDMAELEVNCEWERAELAEKNLAELKAAKEKLEAELAKAHAFAVQLIDPVNHEKTCPSSNVSPDAFQDSLSCNCFLKERVRLKEVETELAEVRGRVAELEAIDSGRIKAIERVNAELFKANERLAAWSGIISDLLIGATSHAQKAACAIPEHLRPAKGG
jgi:hypothetical protein